MKDSSSTINYSDKISFLAYVEGLERRIAELEEINAASSFLEDGWIGRIEAGDKRIAELEAQRKREKWHKYPDEKPPSDGRYLFWDSDGNTPHNLPYNDIVVRDNPGVFSTQTHWRELPAPPEEEK